MKRFSFLTILMVLSMVMSAQMNMYVWQDGVKVIYPVLSVDSITFGEEPEPEPFVSLINVEDGSVADWKKVPANYLATATCASGAKWTALKNVKVYADKEYINVLVEYDPQQITSTDWVPFHVYLNADHSTTTGGSVGQWLDADIEIMMEAAIIADGKHVSYNPGVFEYTGTVGKQEWAWENVEVQEPVIGRSQQVGNKFEIQLSRTLIPAQWDKTGFTIGFDIQQSWNSVGVLPNASSGTNSGKSNMLYVEINWDENTNVEPEEPEIPEVIEETKTYVESEEIFANPERGFLHLEYYESGDLNEELSARDVENYRLNKKQTLYLHVYYLTDYIESYISQDFLERMARNFEALRAGGGKSVIRYAYKYNESESAKPWDADKEWAIRHIKQLQPYWEEYQDVIMCLEAGFIGVWGEWYYTTGFPFAPETKEEWAPRWELVDTLLNNLPKDIQLSLRTPGYKMNYLASKGEAVEPLTKEEAHQNTAKARLSGHNDCFISSSNDVGTYANDEEREFWAADTKYTVMGGETCQVCEYSDGENALREMAKYHWTYINEAFNLDILNSWVTTGQMDEIKRRLGYRFTLEKGTYTLQENVYTAALTIKNLGFAALTNPRGVELVLVNKADANDKYVYKQDIDPRFWMAGETTAVELIANLDADMSGTYSVYLNLPDSHANLHDNPAFSIRLANENMWHGEMGYNYLTDIEL